MKLPRLPGYKSYQESKEQMDTLPAPITEVIDHAVRDAQIIDMIDSKFSELKSSNVTSESVRDLLLDIRNLVAN